ncbi:DUF805 domain-containing protein [Foetidibacter luteolus]|uniref:DUF805 domain-containing protein n=1 Tax=Foetidibacter luteolus TaxID=2608880 RepID=UPI00129A64F7|nr:DUF805 domain-containing protein [Foetidibacter luteolus]
MKHYLNALKNYANFTGRARRSEYWYFILFNVAIFFALALLANISDFYELAWDPFSYVFGLYMLAMLIPWLAVLVRRLHDIGKSGTWFFIYFVPFVGAIWLLVLLCTDSEPGTNKYGLNPKAIHNLDEIDEIGNHLKQ